MFSSTLLSSGASEGTVEDIYLWVPNLNGSLSHDRTALHGGTRPSRKSDRAMEAAKMIIFEEAKERDREWKQRKAEVMNLMKEMRQDKKTGRRRSITEEQS